MISDNQINLIKAITGKHNPSLVGIFGSYSRNEQKHESDLDIIIDFQTTIDLLNLIGIEQELSEKLGVKVDLITLKSINPKLLGYIQKDLLRIV
jgi:uncharacterized protein